MTFIFTLLYFISLLLKLQLMDNFTQLIMSDVKYHGENLIEML